MLILGIETSCDETSAAVVEDGKTIRKSIVYSQVELHKRFNGVVPEIASRNHLEKMLDVLTSALDGISMGSIDAISAVNGPGLVGALLVGLSTAKTLSYCLKKPFIHVNHIYAHMYAPHLFHTIEFPYIGLVASGGHTILFLVRGFHNMEILGSTIDDAVGEAFDKVAKLLGLGYPGGPIIDELAKEGRSDFLDLPVGLSDKEDRYNFSYSGLKTAVSYRIKKIDLNDENRRHVCASFQRAAIEMLYRKAQNALLDTGCKTLVLSGGVAANSYLRQKFVELEQVGIAIYTAPIAYCGDNAAMVAGRAYSDFQAGILGSLKTEVFSRMPAIVKGKRVLV